MGNGEFTGLLLSVRYDGEVGKAKLYFYDISGEKLVVINDPYGHKPYLLTDIPPQEIVQQYPDVLKHRGFDHLEVVKKYDLLHDQEVLMTKVVARDPLSVGGSRGSLRDILKGHAWEANIKYHNCYIYDTGLVPGMLYRVRNSEITPVEVTPPKDILEKMAEVYGHDKELFRELVEWIKLFQAPIPDIKRVAFDIEVYSPSSERVPNPREAKYSVIAVSLAGSDGLKTVLMLKREGMGEMPSELGDGVKLEYFDREEDLIKKTFEILSQYPLVLTFNGDHFDLPYLKNRAAQLGLDDIASQIVLSKGDEAAHLRNSIHIDLYRFFNNRSMQVYAFSNKYRESKTLDDIAIALLGEGKVEHEKSISEMNYVELATYCFKDSELTLRLTQFNDNLVMKLIILMMRISKMAIDDLTRHNISAWIRNMLYFEHRRRGYLIPNSSDIISMKGQTATKAIIKGKKYLGAIVIDPLPGVFFNVVVVDFASLYPSVIKQWNLSYETVRCPHEECRSNTIPGTPHWVCRKKRGLSSKLVGFLRDLRVYVYKPLSKKADDPEVAAQYKVVQQALKVFINASYGVFGAESFALYCPPMAECTTALGRYAITRSIEKALEMGIPVLYGDTDSLFLWNPSPEKVEELIDWVSENLNIDLEVDKVYKWVAFSGRKKNYLGVTTSNKPDVKGLVGKKRNTPEFIKKLFAEVLEILSESDDLEKLESAIDEIKEVTKKSYTKLREKRYSLDELAFRVTLTKPLDAYTKNTPQHVKAARQLARRNIPIEVGDVISFVKTRDGEGVKAVQLARIDEVDIDKYIEHIHVSLQQVLDALGISFKEILGVKLLEKYFTTAVA